MLKIRLNRVGKKNKPFFRIVLQEHTLAPGGRHVEILGSYNPHTKETVLKEERIKYWMEKGVQFSDTVYNLLITKEILSGDKRKIKITNKANKKEAEKETKEDAGTEADKEIKSEENIKSETKEETLVNKAGEPKKEEKEETKENKIEKAPANKDVDKKET